MCWSSCVPLEARSSEKFKMQHKLYESALHLSSLSYIVIGYFIRRSFDWVKGDESWIVVVSE